MSLAADSQCAADVFQLATQARLALYPMDNSPARTPFCTLRHPRVGCSLPAPGSRLPSGGNAGIDLGSGDRESRSRRVGIRCSRLSAVSAEESYPAMAVLTYLE